MLAKHNSPQRNLNHKGLQQSGVDMKKLSIVGRDYYNLTKEAL